MYGKSIFEYDPESRGAEDYRVLVDRIMESLEIVPTGNARPSIHQRNNPTSVAENAQNGIAVPPRPAPTYDLQVCPRCGRDVRYTSAAGYRIMICNSCGHTKQTLVRNVR
jgi:hypothetical protein